MSKKEDYVIKKFGDEGSLTAGKPSGEKSIFKKHSRRSRRMKHIRLWAVIEKTTRKISGTDRKDYVEDQKDQEDSVVQSQKAIPK